MNKISNAARWEKEWGQLVYSRIESNFPLPYSTMPVPQFKDARPTGWVTFYSTVYARVQRREPKTGQEKVQFSRKTKHFAHLGILFIYVYMTHSNTAVTGKRRREVENAKIYNWPINRAGTVYSVTTAKFFNEWKMKSVFLLLRVTVTFHLVSEMIVVLRCVNRLLFGKISAWID